jgi:organic radical activating enzyme
MFDIEEFITCADRGMAVDIDGFREYVNAYETVSIWGAGNLGTAVGKKLIEDNIKVSYYWDAQADKIKNRNGVPVKQIEYSFDKKNKILVIFCISNEAVAPFLLMDFKQRGYDYLPGKSIFYAFICPISDSSVLNTEICNAWDVCSACGCKRLYNVVCQKILRKKELPEDNMLAFDRIHFITNNTCNLKCKYCISMMNSYRQDQKKFMPLERIYKDIDKVMKAIDAIGVVNVFGGEPFLHKDISKIVKKVLEYDNFGAMIINTNGVAHIDENQLDGLDDVRIRVACSNYSGQINAEQEGRFKNNYDMMKNKGIIVKTQNVLPMWSVPCTVHKAQNANEDVLTKRRRNCPVPYLYVFNGRIFPCLQALLVFDLEVADNNDYIKIDDVDSIEELRQRIFALRSKQYYKSCDYCYGNDGNEYTNKAGEQGVEQRYIITERNEKGD